MFLLLLRSCMKKYVAKSLEEKEISKYLDLLGFLCWLILKILHTSKSCSHLLDKVCIRALRLYWFRISTLLS